MIPVDVTIYMNESAPICQEAFRLLRRNLEERGVKSGSGQADSADVILRVSPGPGVDGYCIDEQGGSIRISGHDPRGLLYGVGRFLHDASFSKTGIKPGAWRGTSRPDCSLRGIYFAHNFRNWYRSAPQADVERYIEELALWGMNAALFPVGTNPHSPASEIHDVMIPRQVEIMKLARRLGIRVGTILTSVIDHAPDPAIAAIPVPDATPARRGNAGHKVCMSHPDGVKAMRHQLEHDLALYAGVGLDFVVPFPYDEGGCGCTGCYPWGAKGYVVFCKMLAEVARAQYPGCQLIAGTWCFDVLEKSDGEFDGFDAAIRAEPGWCNMVMTDAHESFPEWPLKHGSPGGLPMINFAEISMWGRFPWGGSGANPFPRRLVEIWKQSRHLLDGGFPYSEGRFEDINKVTCLRLFWDKTADAGGIVNDYVVSEFGRERVGEIAEAIQLLEENYPVNPPDLKRAERALALLQGAEASLTERVRTSWRWRLLMVRAVIDVETALQPKGVSDKRNAAYEELIDLYCAQTAQLCVCPRAKSAFERKQIR